MADKAPYTTADRRYVPTRSDTPGQAPALQQGELGVNEATGVAHIMRANGRVSTLAAADGFERITTLSDSEYAELVATSAVISTVLYIVTPDPVSE